MTVEIREVVLRVTVVDEPRRNTADRSAEVDVAALEARLVAACEARIRAALRRRTER